MRKFLLLIFIFCTSMSVYAQSNEWTPKCSFPLLFERMEKATIHYGIVRDNTKFAPCNIHLGTSEKFQTLYYVDTNGTVIECEPSSVNKIEFPDGEYIPIAQKYFGKIIFADSVGKVVLVRDIDRPKFAEQRAMTSSATSRIDMNKFRWYVPTEDDENIPMRNLYWFIVRGKIFEVTETNILSNINPLRKKEYKAYTRFAEVILKNERSVIDVWNNFFENYDNPLPFYKKRK